MEAFRQLLNSICLRPAMHVGRESLIDVSHYLAGYCHALDDTDSGLNPLDGWIRWVEMRFVVSSPSWHWTRTLLHNYGDDAACLSVFPSLYDEFTADRERLGVSGIETESRRRIIEKYGRSYGHPESTHTAAPSER